MKKLLLFLTVILFIGCSKDEPSLSKSQIAGKWNVTQAWSYQQNAYIDFAIMDWYAQFNLDGTYESYDNSTHYGTYEINGNSIVSKVGSTVVTYKMTSISGNKAECELTYQSTGYVDKYKVTRE